MRLEDIDFEYVFGDVSQKLSTLTESQIDQINKISEAILHQRIFDCPTKAILAAFQLWLEAEVSLLDFDTKHTIAH